MSERTEKEILRELRKINARKEEKDFDRRAEEYFRKYNEDDPFPPLLTFEEDKVTFDDD